MSADRSESTRILERELGTLIRRLKRVVVERSHEIHAELQPASYWMLIHLAEGGPIRASAVVEHLDLDKGAVSRHVQHLIDLGLVDRTADPSDGRATLLSVSDDGQRRLADVDGHRRKWFDEVLGSWTDQELADFGAELTRYNTTVDRARAERDGGRRDGR